MDAAKVGMAVQQGVSIYCATCKRFWKGRERRLPFPKCTSLRPCGGPLSGLAFPEYDGPITHHTRWCFVCGEKATKGLRVKNSERTIGVCDEHVTMVGNVEAVGLNGRSVEEIVSNTVGALTPEQFFGPPQQTLGQAIAEAEAYFQDQDIKKARR